MPKLLIFYILVCTALSAPNLMGQSRTIDLGDEFEVKKLVVPYAFYNENLKFALGATYGVTGWPQEQAALLTSAIVSTNGSNALYFFGRNLQVPPFERVFLDPEIGSGRYGLFESYTDGNPKYAFERAGSHKSHDENFIEGDGTDDFIRLKLKYLLPMGHGRDTVINTYVLDNGLLHDGATGGETWNPLESGRTYLELKPFYRRQRTESDDYNINSLKKSNGLEFAVFHDNTDFFSNPTCGSQQRFAVSRDWGKWYSSNPWTVVEAEFSKYFDLGPTENLRQQVIALNVWTANSLTWDSSHREKNGRVFHRPPLYAGATLGGLDRMRGYPASRFHDQAAIFYGLEYRIMPEWHPLGEVELMKPLELAWWQIVPFVEAGRVADTWNLDKLHTDLKWDAGVGIRLMAKRLVVRMDLAVSDEGGGIQMMVGHPF